jgi:hypothetical protein
MKYNYDAFIINVKLDDIIQYSIHSIRLEHAVKLISEEAQADILHCNRALL